MSTTTDLPRPQLARLRVLARGARAYGITDTINPQLEKRGLIASTTRAVGHSRREYIITEVGQSTLGQLNDAD